MSFTRMGAVALYLVAGSAKADAQQADQTKQTPPAASSGGAKATTAPAHKLAKIIYHMLKEKTSYRERGAEYYLHRDQERKLKQLRKQAKHLGFDLVPQASH